jgi:steroid delta-isomerase
MTIDELIDFYHGLAPESIARFPEFYSADAYFKDPFNEVRGVAAIQHIFSHMFRQVGAPRFIVSERVVDEHAVLLVWTFHYLVRKWGKDQAQVIRGVSHLKFDADGRVNFHRDYWDAAEELYMKLPVLGMLMRRLRRALAA